MKRRMATWNIIIWGAIFLAACVNLATSTSTNTRYYMLESIVDSAIQPESASGSRVIPIGIGPVDMAPYLARPQMVTRLSEQELRVDDFNQWAEPLQVTLSRVLAENLTVLTGSPLIRSYPWKRSDAIRMKVNVDVLRFDADTAGRVTLKTVWRIVDSKDHRLLGQRQSTVIRDATGSDPTHVVQAMNLALAELSRELAECLMQLAIC